MRHTLSNSYRDYECRVIQSLSDPDYNAAVDRAYQIIGELRDRPLWFDSLYLLADKVLDRRRNKLLKLVES